MGAVYFYHLTRRPLEVTLANLADRALAAGWPVAVRARSEGMLALLDDQLWLQPEDGFLPHGRAGTPREAAQPILLTLGSVAANAPRCIFSVEGAAVDPDEVTALDRVCVLFDGHDPVVVQHAREQWKTLTTAGCAAQYWSEEGGAWKMKAESPGAD